MRNLGLIALVASIAIAMYSAYAFFVGTKSRKGSAQQKSASWGMILQFLSVTFSSLILFIAFLKNDFTFAYVADHSMAKMSTFYKISAFWAGHEGSLLLWLWMLTGYTAVLAYMNIRNNDRLKSLALYVANFIQMFLAITIIVATNPFRAAVGPIDNGMGLNPLLMHWAMVLHPPTLFMGYAGATIPFAFAIAALLDRNASSEWVDRAHKWTLFGWSFLTVGIFLGALWAYVVLGWGGYWAWDPVENASILPWFTGTALLHTFTMYRRRGGMKLWAIWLATLSFVMCIMATFITRSGLISSVHAFPELRVDLTSLFGGLMVVAIAVTLYLTKTRKTEFEAKEAFSDFMSRHFTYYINNFALVTFTFIILGATVIPPFFKTNLDPDFYNRLAQPLGLLYLALITICPFLGWQKTDANAFLKQLALPAVVAAAAAVPLYMSFGSDTMGFLTLIAAVFSFTATLELFLLTTSKRAKNQEIGFLSAFGRTIRFNRSLTGGYLSHLGMAVMFFGIAGSMLYVQEIPALIKNEPGQKVQVGDYELIYKTHKQGNTDIQSSYTTIFDLKDTRTGKIIGKIQPSAVMHNASGQQTVNASVHYELFRDIFVVLNGVDEQNRLSLSVRINPLISFVWAGSFILTFGTMIAMWPKRATATEPVEAKATVSARRKKNALADAK